MGLFGKKKSLEDGEIISFDAFHEEGLGLSNFTMCNLHLFQDKIIIDANNKAKNKYEIPKERLKMATVEVIQETVEKGKSVLGRAAVGGVLLGPVGAVVGGISGTGKKVEKKPPEHFLVITYFNSEGNETSLRFKNNFNIFKIDKFAAELNKLILDSKSMNGTVVL